MKNQIQSKVLVLGHLGGSVVGKPQLVGHVFLEWCFWVKQDFISHISEEYEKQGKALFTHTLHGLGIGLTADTTG